MEKLSSILPGSPRVKSVDLKNAQPARPGAPLFGRPNGSVSSDRLTLSAEARDMAFQETMGAGRNPREMAQTQIAKDVTKKFFETRLDAPVQTAYDRMEVSMEAPVDAAETADVAVPETTAKPA